MLGLLIELRTTCQRCGSPLPVNAVSDRIICRACNHATKIDDELWATLLEDAFREHTSFEEDEGQSSTMMTGDGTWEITYGRQEPRCGACKTTVPDQALAFAERGWAMCVECGKRFGIRPAPPVIARFGAVALVNEDPAQIATTTTGEALAMPAAANPIVFSCPRCSGALTVDGATRLVRCQYCSSDVYLPDDLWQRLHPVAMVTRWYAWFTEDLEQRKRSAFRWSSILDVVIGTDQLLYCLGTDDDMDEHVVVWCMSFDLQIRWLRDDVGVTAGFGRDASLAVDSGGRLYAWTHDQPTAVVLSCADGATLGTLGAPEPAGAKAHGFDLREAKQLHADIDGTLLALIDERLVRYAADGSPLATWPPRSGLFGAKAEKLRPLYADGCIQSLGSPSIEEVKDHPLGLARYTKLAIGADGRLHAAYENLVGCFDRAGKLVHRARMPISADDVAVDGAGHLHVLGKVDGRHMLVRIAADGARVDVIATDRASGGVLGDESTLVASPYGLCLLFGHSHRMRVIGPDGRLVSASDASKRADADD